MAWSEAAYLSKESADPSLYSEALACTARQNCYRSAIDPYIATITPVCLTEF